MNQLFRIIVITRPRVLYNPVVNFSDKAKLKQGSRPLLRGKESTLEQIGLYGWFLLAIPVTSFGLGVWQVKRKFWKENLLSQLCQITGSTPIELPQSLKELKDLEYHPIHVQGTFLHEKEIYMGPRSLIRKEDSSTPKSFFQDTQSQGYLVVTPFKLADRDETILVNRGWVPTKKLKPSSRAGGQIDGVVDVIGLLRLNENRPNFSIKNKEGSNLYFYRDLASMCTATGALPIFLDQTTDFNIQGGPIGGQTRVTLRNEHLSYIITWFSLSAATSYMWMRKYVFKAK
ncbi:surfeit locus protein 1 [Euwallacea similis]|uniref:surfeit locus protein 1 n=1 Tax=Euwallacea similis TaxID=1736056 RepID=UPI00344C6BCE